MPAKIVKRKRVPSSPKQRSESSAPRRSLSGVSAVSKKASASKNKKRKLKLKSSQNQVEFRPNGPTLTPATEESAEQKTSSTEHLNKWKWKKGQSGNPAGKPKGTISLTHHLRRLLEENVVIKKNGKRKNITTAEQLIEVAVKAARKGKFNFFKEIYERIDGKVPDHLIQETTKRMVKQEAANIAAEIMDLVSKTLEKHIDDDAKVADILVELADKLESRYNKTEPSDEDSDAEREE